jgi:2'-5' RNA ligase
MLTCLQRRIEDRLQQIGLPAKTRPFVPHVKLAHLKRRRSLRAFLTETLIFMRVPFRSSVSASLKAVRVLRVRFTSTKRIMPCAELHTWKNRL